MLYELRTYRAHPGKRDEFVNFMESTVLPFQRENGVDVVANFSSPDDPDAYVWIRRFSSAEERERVTGSMYSGDRWTNDMLPTVAELLDRDATTVMMLEPTPGSPLQ